MKKTTNYFLKYQIIIIFAILIGILSFTSCNRTISEGQQQFQREQTIKKQKLKDSILALSGTTNSEMDKNYILHFNNGKLAHNRGDYDEAINLFDECVNLNQNFADGWGWRGLSKLKLGDSQGACDDWKKSVELGATNFQNLIDDNCL